MRAYAFRAGPAIAEVWGASSSSAEWPEGLALELGDRVSLQWFTEIMHQAFYLQPWPWV